MVVITPPANAVPVEHDRVLGHVRRHEGEDVALGEASRHEPAGQRPDALLERRVRQRPSGGPVDEGGLVAEFSRPVQGVRRQRLVRDVDVGQRTAMDHRAFSSPWCRDRGLCCSSRAPPPDARVEADSTLLRPADARRLVIVTTTRTPTIAARPTVGGICGTAGQTPWAQCRTSLRPMTPRMIARPYPRWTSRLSAPASRKYSARRPRRANALVASTREGSVVMPNTAGTESTAKTTSVARTATTATASGVRARRP